MQAKASIDRFTAVARRCEHLAGACGHAGDGRQTPPRLRSGRGATEVQWRRRRIPRLLRKRRARRVR